VRGHSSEAASARALLDAGLPGAIGSAARNQLCHFYGNLREELFGSSRFLVPMAFVMYKCCLL
jgi:hypothetical protein